jgi:hypothetical protein
MLRPSFLREVLPRFLIFVSVVVILLASFADSRDAWNLLVVIVGSAVVVIGTAMFRRSR